MSEKSSSSFWDKVPFLQKLKNIKHIELIIVAIFLIIIGIVFMSTKTTNSDTEITSESLSTEQYQNNLEKKLSDVLGQIEGAGKVSVMITLNGGITYEYATESEEVTTSSSVTNGTNTKTTTTENIVIVTINGKSTPLIVREIYPDIVGVVVVSSGAGDIAVKLNILRAVETVLEVSDSNIEIIVGTK